MTACEECKYSYPDELVRELTLGDPKRAPIHLNVCAICAYKLASAFHGKPLIPDPKTSPKATELLRRCEEYRAKAN